MNFSSIIKTSHFRIDRRFWLIFLDLLMDFETKRRSTIDKKQLKTDQQK